MERTRTTSSDQIGAALPFFVSDSRRFLLLVAVDLALFAALIAFFQWSGHAGTQLALVPTLIAVTATKYFGKSKDEESVFGNHPAVAFTFKAFATGEFTDVDEMVSEDFSAYANGYSVVGPESDNGPVRFVENINYWRRVVPDLSVAIYDEVSQKEPDKTDSVAVRFVFTGTMTAPDLAAEHKFETEAAAFIKVVDHKIVEWRVVADATFLDELRSPWGTRSHSSP
jgi:hypothetical protein